MDVQHEQQAVFLGHFAEALHHARRARHLTLRTLAARTGVSSAVLSAFERGKAVPALDTLQRLAAALHTSMAALLAERQPAPTPFTIMRRAERAAVTVHGGRHAHYETPLTSFSDGLQEMNVAFIGLKRSSFRPALFSVRGDVLVFGLAGRFSYVCDGERHVIAPGDALLFRGQLPHGPETVLTATAEYLIVHVNEIFGWLDMQLDARHVRRRPTARPRGFDDLQTLALRLRRARLRCDYPKQLLCRLAGLSEGMIAHIEAGRSAVSVPALVRIARALRMPVAALFDDAHAVSDVVCLRRADQREVAHGGHRAASLVPAAFGPPLYLPEIRSFTRRTFRPQLTTASGQFFALVLDGAIALHHGATTLTLREGDLVYGLASARHGVAKLLSARASVLWCRSDLTRLYVKTLLRRQTAPH
jgi:transcriptional regulator with XRE-family HTH domain/quercetin dioxygenase-like cupin family protein